MGSKRVRAGAAAGVMMLTSLFVQGMGAGTAHAAQSFLLCHSGATVGEPFGGGVSFAGASIGTPVCSFDWRNCAGPCPGDVGIQGVGSGAGQIQGHITIQSIETEEIIGEAGFSKLGTGGAGTQELLICGPVGCFGAPFRITIWWEGVGALPDVAIYEVDHGI